MANKRAKNGEMEYRFTRSAPAEAAEDGTLSGRAAPFNSTTMIGEAPWGFREKIAPGAFKKSINDGDVVLLDNHDHAKPIARQSAGTLALTETSGGLDWDATPANTTYANDARENAKAGNYGGCSFGFQVPVGGDTWHYNADDDVDERTIHEVKLHEISVCTFPAYADTTVSARDAAEAAEFAKERYYEREYEKLYVIGGVPQDDDDEERDADDADEADEDGRAGAKKTPKPPYGNVKYADPGYQADKQKRYPIDTAAHAKAAWSYINMPKNEALYSAANLTKVKNAIKAACKKFGITIANSKDSALQDVAEIRENKMAFLDKVTDLALSEDREPATVLAELRRLCVAELRAQIAADTRAVNDVSDGPSDNTPLGDGNVGDFRPECETCNSTGKVGDSDDPCPDCGAANVEGDDTGDQDGKKQTPAFGLNADPDLQDKQGANNPTTGEHSQNSDDETRTDEDDDDLDRRRRFKLKQLKRENEYESN